MAKTHDNVTPFCLFSNSFEMMLDAEHFQAGSEVLLTWFLPRDAKQSTVLAVGRCPSVRLSVSLSVCPSVTLVYTQTHIAAETNNDEAQQSSDDLGVV